MTVDARHLRAFLAIATHGSITHAATVLHLSQPAVSRLLRQLEDHLGRRLVDRSTHHLQLTADGERFVVRAAGVVQGLDSVLDPASLGTLALRVGYAWSAFGGRSAALLAEWREQHASSPVDLRRIDDRLGGLLMGDVHAAIVRDMNPARQVQRRWICAEPRVAAVPTGHSSTRRDRVQLGELAGETIVVNTVSGTTRTSWWPEGQAPTRIVEVRNTDDWLVAIASGAGVVVTSAATAEMYAAPDVAFVPIVDAPPVTVEVAWLSPPTHPLVEAFAAHCRRILAT